MAGGADRLRLAAAAADLGIVGGEVGALAAGGVWVPRTRSAFSNRSESTRAQPRLNAAHTNGRVPRLAADPRAPPPRTRIYTAHYNSERPHRGLALRAPESANTAGSPTTGEIKRRDRLGGLIHEYHRAAA